MASSAALTALSALSRATSGVFRGDAAVARGVTRKQLNALRTAEIIERVLPDTYRMTAVALSGAQRLRAALLWAGDEAAAAGRSAGAQYGLEGVHAQRPEIVVPKWVRRRHPEVDVYFTSDTRRLLCASIRASG